MDYKRLYMQCYQVNCLISVVWLVFMLTNYSGLVFGEYCHAAARNTHQSQRIYMQSCLRMVSTVHWLPYDDYMHRDILYMATATMCYSICKLYHNNLIKSLVKETSASVPAVMLLYELRLLYVKLAHPVLPWEQLSSHRRSYHPLTP